MSAVNTYDEIVNSILQLVIIAVQKLFPDQRCFWENYRLLDSSVKRSILAYNGQISVTTNIFESELVSMMFLA